MEIVSLVIAILSACFAGAAWRQARRSAAAAERSAASDETTAAIETERIGHERRQRSIERMPHWRVVGFATLNSNHLEVQLENTTETCTIDSCALLGFDGPIAGTATLADGSASREVTAGTSVILRFADPQQGQPRGGHPLRVSVVASTDDGAARSRYTVNLLRDGSDHTGLPVWRAGDATYVPV